MHHWLSASSTDQNQFFSLAAAELLKHWCTFTADAYKHYSRVFSMAGPKLDVPQHLSSVKQSQNVIYALHSMHPALLLADEGGAQHGALEE